MKIRKIPAVFLALLIAACSAEWLETIYDRNDELERLTQETLRLEAEADVDRLLG
jgi:hypothetical protein